METQTQKLLWFIVAGGVILTMCALSVLYMRDLALDLCDTNPRKVAAWASLATFALLPVGGLAAWAGSRIGLHLGRLETRERLRGIDQGTTIMSKAARDVVEIRRSAPPAPSVVIHQPAPQTDDLIIRPAQPTSSRRTAVDMVDLTGL